MSCKQVQMNMIAFIYVTLTFLILQILQSTMLGEFLIFMLHTIVFITVYVPFYSDHPYYEYFRILRDRSFSRISDEDWGKLFLMLLWNVTTHFVFLIFNVFIQLRKYFPFAAVNINEFSLLTMILIVRSIIFLNIDKKQVSHLLLFFVSCRLSPFLSLGGCQLLFFFQYVLYSCPLAPQEQSRIQKSPGHYKLKSKVLGGQDKTYTLI